MYHKPVLLKEVLEHLKVNKNAKYIDATLGDGGHAVEILKMGGTVLGLDVNPAALQRAADRIEDIGLSENFTGAAGNFKDVEEMPHMTRYQYLKQGAEVIGKWRSKERD